MRRKKAGWNLYAFYVIMFGAAPAYMYAAEKIYKTTDEYGVPLYTNTPPGPGARPIDVPELSIIPAPDQDAPVLEDPMRPPLQLAEDTTRQRTSPSPGNNYNIAILSPREDETVRIAGSTVPVRLALEPPLDVEAGHSIELFVDGVETQVIRDTEASLAGLDRGSHQLMVQVVNDADEVLQSSNTVTFYAQQSTAYGTGR